MQKQNTVFPKSMTNCPDYWEVNPTNGNCIIPSADIPNANLGTIKGNGYPVYYYNFADKQNKKDNIYTVYKTYNYRDRNINGIKYNDKNGYQLYVYNYDNNDDVPYGYYQLDSSSTILTLLPPPPKDKPYSSEELTLVAKEKHIQQIIDNGNEINFNDPQWSKYNKTGSRICNVKKWINDKNIVWDGLSNSNYYNCEM
jgi:hypothetical protein